MVVRTFHFREKWLNITSRPLIFSFFKIFSSVCTGIYRSLGLLPQQQQQAATHAGPPHRLWRFTAWENRWKKKADIIVMPTLATAATAQTSWFHHQVIETDSPTTPRNCWTNFSFWVSRPIFSSPASMDPNSGKSHLGLVLCFYWIKRRGLFELYINRGDVSL